MDEEYYETLCKINFTCIWYSCCFVWPQACCWLQRNSNTARRTSQIFWPSGSWRTQVSKAMWWEGDLILLTNFFWFCISFSLRFKHYMCVWEFSTLGTWFLCVDLFFFSKEKSSINITLCAAKYNWVWFCHGVALPTGMDRYLLEVTIWGAYRHILFLLCFATSCFRACVSLVDHCVLIIYVS